MTRIWMFLAAVLALGCDGSSGGFPGPAPSPLPSSLPTPVPKPPTVFPSIQVGEVIHFQFTVDDVPCDGGAGRCRSYNVTAPSDGQLEVVLAAVSQEDGFIATTEMYVVPGGDFWNVGPGPRISVTIPVRSGNAYEIRMYSAKMPSVELELRAAMQ